MKSATIAKKFYKELGVSKFKEVANEYHVDDDIVFLKRQCRKKDIILDLACGYGRVTLPLAKGGYHITGIDISKDLILDARRNAKLLGLHINFDIGDMMKLPYVNKSFDKVFCMWNSFNSLLTKKDQLTALNEAYRVLKPGGRMFVVLINGEEEGLKRELRENGVGKEKRIWNGLLKGVTFSMYIHNRVSIKDLCVKSAFKGCKISLRKMNNTKRIVVLLAR